VLKEETSLTEKEIEHFWICDEDQNILIYQGQIELSTIQKEMILKIIENIHLNGPLCGETLTEIKITIENLSIKNLNEESIFTELSSMFYEAIKKGLNESELILLEPIYHTFIQLPPNHVKNTLSLLSKHSAKINSIDQEDEYQSVIEILIPVRNSMKFAEDIRSTTSGKAFWQNEFFAYLDVPPHESTAIINELRFIKGLSW
jgi:elongation factor 2